MVQRKNIETEHMKRKYRRKSESTKEKEYRACIPSAEYTEAVIKEEVAGRNDRAEVPDRRKTDARQITEPSRQSKPAAQNHSQAVKMAQARRSRSRE